MSWPFRCTVNRMETGSAPSQLLPRQLSYIHRKHTRLLPLQATSQLFTASSNRFIVHQETWKSGTAAWGSGASYLGRTMLVYTTKWHQGPSLGIQGIKSMACPWPRGDHTVTILSNKSSCCISKSVLKLSYCSKAFQSVWMQHF